MIKQVEFMGLNLTLVGTKEKIQLEKALGCSPLNFIFGMMGGATNEQDIDFSKIQIPTMPVMTTILHASAQKLNAGVSIEKMMDLIDIWLENDEENSVFSLFTVVMEVLQTGKYLPYDNQETIEKEETIHDCLEA